MALNRKSFSAFCLSCVLILGMWQSTFAQTAQPAQVTPKPVVPVTPPVPPAAQGQQPAPPKSGLGKQVEPPAPLVVKPSPQEVVDDTIKEVDGMQLTDDQYELLKKLFLRREKQRALPYVSPAKPVTRTFMVNLDPGVSPPVLRLTRGQFTSVVFSDIRGEPWLIDNVALNRELYNDGTEKNTTNKNAIPPTNVLTIEPLSPAVYGNVAIRLKGLSTPIIFVMTAAQQEVDIRVDAKVPGHNPDATDVVTMSNMPNIDASLTSFLDGVPPREAKRLHVSGLPNTEAWIYNDNMYVRTDADVQYPAYWSAARSTSGKSVYRFKSRHNSVTLLAYGKAVTIFIED